MTCETVVIEGQNGPTIINKTDFDEKKHTLVGEKKPAKKKDVKKKDVKKKDK